MGLHSKPPNGVNRLYFNVYILGECEFKMNKINVLLTILLASALLVLTACSNDEPDTEGVESEAQETAPTRERTIRREEPVAQLPPPSANEDPSKKIPRRTGQTEEEGFGLTLMVDGSSPEAFAESLELIASDSTQEQYRQLDSALRYLQVYSSDGWSGLPGFYERLNGMTGEEIIRRARRLQQERRGN